MAWSGLPVLESRGSGSGSAASVFLTDMIEWNRENAKSMKMGMLSGTGSDASGNNLMTFTGIGWGFGLLLADDIETFLLMLFTVASHANTRGTWTAPEGADIGGGAMPYCSSSQMVMPIHLKWMLVFEHPRTEELWLGRAIPRAWLAQGLGGGAGGNGDGKVSVGGAPSSWGRLSFELSSQLSSTGCIHANITLHSATRGLPAGGVVLRLRTPGKRSITSMRVGGLKVPAARWNASDETVLFPRDSLEAEVVGMQDVVVCYAQ